MFCELVQLVSMRPHSGAAEELPSLPEILRPRTSMVPESTRLGVAIEVGG
jgi:hypothetical protein